MLSKDITELIRKVSKKKTLFVGLGNKQRRDDAVGLYIVETLQKNPPNNLNFLLANTTPENYLATMIRFDPEFIVFIDAVKNQREIGTISKLSEKEISTFATSTHTSSILMITEYLQKSIGANIEVIGVTVQDTKLGEEISPKVYQSAAEFIELF